MTPIRRPQSVVLGAALAAAALCALPAAAFAAGDAPRLITLSGTGEVHAAPDQAQLTAGVVSQAKTAAAALADNSRKMNAVFAAINKLGVPDKSIQTSGFNVSPQYPAYNSGEPRHITGYQVTNSVTVRLSDLRRVGPALDALVAAGANDINSVSFSIADPKPLLAKARTEAVRAAMAEASTYAKAAGVKLGPIQSIQEGGNAQVRPMMAMRVMAESATPIATGEQSVSATVTIAWQIQ